MAVRRTIVHKNITLYIYRIIFP